MFSSDIIPDFEIEVTHGKAYEGMSIELTFSNESDRDEAKEYLKARAGFDSQDLFFEESDETHLLCKGNHAELLAKLILEDPRGNLSFKTISTLVSNVDSNEYDSKFIEIQLHRMQEERTSKNRTL